MIIIIIIINFIIAIIVFFLIVIIIIIIFLKLKFTFFTLFVIDKNSGPGRLTLDIWRGHKAALKTNTIEPLNCNGHALKQMAAFSWVSCYQGNASTKLGQEVSSFAAHGSESLTSDRHKDVRARQLGIFYLLPLRSALRCTTRQLRYDGKMGCSQSICNCDIPY